MGKKKASGQCKWDLFFYPFSHFPFLKIYLSGGSSEYFDRPKREVHRGRQDFYCYFGVSGQDNGHVTFLHSFERHESWSPRHSVHDNTMRAAGLLFFWDPTNLAFAERLHYLLLYLPSSSCTFVGFAGHTLLSRKATCRKSLLGYWGPLAMRYLMKFIFWYITRNYKLKKKKQNQGLEYKHTYRQDKMLLPFRL